MLKRSKKGFTLIEMMIVIAVVAVLVAVIIPIVNGSTVKANAATNAANLRSVEGELTAMMLINPDAFGDKLDTQNRLETEIYIGENIVPNGLEAAEAALQAAIDNREANLKRIAKLGATISGINAKIDEINVDGLKAAYEESKKTCTGYTDWRGNVKHGSLLGMGGCACGQAEDAYNGALVAKAAQDKLLGPAADELNNAEKMKATYDKAVEEAQTNVDNIRQANADNVAANKDALNNLYRYEVVDGYITLEDGTKIETPVAKAVDKDGVTVAKDTPMNVYVNPYEKVCVTTYDTYTKFDFAKIAGEKAE